MKTFKVNILGSMAALPYKGRLTSLQAIEIHGRIILLDCGEGAQINLSKYKIPLSKCDVICISHLHGDHVYGLPGILSSMEHAQRQRSLVIIGPTGIQAFVQTVRELTFQHLSFPIDFIECIQDDKTRVYETNSYQIFSFPLQHRIPTYGYILEEVSRKKSVSKQAITHYQLSIEEIKQAVLGLDVVRQNETIPNELLTKPKSSLRSYAYCSDTSFEPALAEHLEGVQVLYHEATYTHDLQSKAKERKHSTAKEAATIAKIAKVKQLILGHFSSRYPDVSVLKAEAAEIFPNVILGIEGVSVDIA